LRPIRLESAEGNSPQAIVAALYTAFAQKQQLTTEVLLQEMHSTQPLSVTRAEEVASIREWAKTRAAPAD
jgi:hypothetical protein